MPLSFNRNRNLNRNDTDLVNLYKKSGDIQVLGELYERYMHLVYGICLKYFKDRERSKDAVMQIFEKLIIDVKNHQIMNFRAWLYVLTKNFCLMQFRKDGTAERRIKAYFEENYMENTIEIHPIDESEMVDMNEILLDCLKRLKEKQKDCVELFYFHNKSYREISRLFQIQEKEVKSFIQNGKRNLKICIEEHEQRQTA